MGELRPYWRALSLRQPWLWMVLRGKGIENRRKFLGSFHEPFLLHAAASKGQREEVREWDKAWDFVDEHFPESFRRTGVFWRSVAPPAGEYERGGYCGVARAVAVLRPDGAVHGDFSTAKLGSDVATVTENGQAAPVEFDLRWWMREQFGYLLTDVRELAFVPGPGMLGFFRVPADIVAKLGLPTRPELWTPAPDPLS